MGSKLNRIGVKHISRSRAGRVAPRADSFITREGEFEFDVGEMDCQVSDALEKSVRALESAVECTMALDYANDVFYSESPVIKLCIEFDLRLR